VYLTAHTTAQVQGYFALADLGAMEVKGVQAPLHVYELQGLGQLRTRLDVSRSRGFSRFVGRGDEMQALESALAQAQAGSARIVGIVGEAGLGKSRLCFEFLERCRARGLMTYETAGVAHGKAIPFLPILRFFRAFHGITDQDSDATAREKIAGRLLLLDERLRETLPATFDFFGVPDPEHPAPRMDPEARQRQSFDVVRRVIQARGQKETMVMLLEDLHWFDGGSEAYLEPLLDASAGTRNLIIVNFRPEYHAAWMGKSYYQQLALLPLGTEAIRQLLDALLGTDPSIVGLAEAIHARTAGNPFFTEEVVLSLIESGKLHGSTGAYRLVTPVDTMEVPASVHALLAARIDRLGERDKRVLQTAAVIGREFDEPTLAAVAELPAPQLREALQTLKSAEFVYEQALYPVAEYLFKHPLTHEVALASQLHERRKRLHAAVARVLEAAHADHLDEEAALLAHHWEAAGETEPAARWHRRAAEWVGVRDPAEAMRHWQRVRQIARGSADSVEPVSLGAVACQRVLSMGWRIGLSEADEAGVFAEGKRWAQQVAQVDTEAWLESSYAGVRCLAGDNAGALVRLAEFERLASLSANAETRTMGWAALTYAVFVSGDLDAAQDRFDRAIEATREHPQFGLEVFGFSFYAQSVYLRGWVEAFRGDLAMAWQMLEQGAQAARDQGDLATEGFALMLSTPLALIDGNVEAALPRVRQAVEIAERIGSPFSRIWGCQCLGAVLRLNGQWQEAIELHEQALRTARERRTGLEGEALYLAYLAEAYLAGGDLPRARAAAEAGVAAGARTGARVFEQEAQRALARVLLRQEGAAAGAAIRAALDRAEALIRETGAKNYQPFIHLERAELARLEGDARTRVRELREAHRLFVEMGATGQAERISRQLSAVSPQPEEQ
jgi:adenylate cyclase